MSRTTLIRPLSRRNHGPRRAADGPRLECLEERRLLTNFSLWSPSATPAVPGADDSASVELGTQFSSDVNGSVTAIRFYKDSTNTGTHIGSLWTASGTLLASVTFTGETASGWQQAQLAHPVAIYAGTSYVVSYHASAGHYADNYNYFASPYTSGPLHVPANGGVYAYSGAQTFPTQTYNASNYWVDLVFSTPPNTAPAVASQSPSPKATGVATNTAVTATFFAPVQTSSITTSNVTLKNPAGTAVAATVSYNSSTMTATLTPSSRLANSTTYTATISGVTDSSGHVMSRPFTWSFTTSPVPAVTSKFPAAGATGVAKGTTVMATFNEAMQAGTIAFRLTSASGAAVAANVFYIASTHTALLIPSSALAYSTTYTATVAGARDAGGDPMAAPVSWSFTTAAAPPATTGDPTTLAPSLGRPPSPSSSVIWVNTVSALQSAVANLVSGQTIVIQPGTYNLTSTLYVGLNSSLTNVTIRGATDNFNDVVLLGHGMDNASYGYVPMGISIWHAQHVTIADLSIGRTYYDPIEIKGDVGASAVTVYHDRLFDAGEQFVKVDPPSSGVGASNSAVEYTLIEYTAGPPTTDHGGGLGYTNGIDIHDGQNWTISHNLIRNLHIPDSDVDNLWDPAILIWNHSSNVTVDGNTIINCDRAIAFGLVVRSSGYDNQGGVIRNNFIYQAPGLFSASRVGSSDGQILVWDSPNTQVLFNTILTDGNSTDSIQLRWTTTGAVVTGNLSDAPIGTRDGATYTGASNYLSATRSMFVMRSAGDLHLVVNAATQAYVIGKATAVANDPDDWNRRTRTAGSATNIGADASITSSSAAVAAAASAGPSVGVATPASTAAPAAPATTASSSSGAARPGVLRGGTRAAAGVVVAGPLSLAPARQKRAGQTASKKPWSHLAF
jgi:hypothetical protein